MRALLYILSVTVIYLMIGIIGVFVYKFCPIEFIQLAYCAILSLPLWIKPIADWCHMKTIWESK